MRKYRKIFNMIVKALSKLKRISVIFKKDTGYIKINVMVIFILHLLPCNI